MRLISCSGLKLRGARKVPLVCHIYYDGRIIETWPCEAARFISISSAPSVDVNYDVEQGSIQRRSWPTRTRNFFKRPRT